MLVLYFVGDRFRCCSIGVLMRKIVTGIPAWLIFITLALYGAIKGYDGATVLCLVILAQQMVTEDRLKRIEKQTDK